MFFGLPFLSGLVHVVETYSVEPNRAILVKHSGGQCSEVRWNAVQSTCCSFSWKLAVLASEEHFADRSMLREILLWNTLMPRKLYTHAAEY